MASDKGAMFPPINQAKERVLAPLRTGHNVNSNTRLEAKHMYPDNAANLLCDFAQIPSSLSLDLNFPSSQSSVIPMSSKSPFYPRISSLSLLPNMASSSGCLMMSYPAQKRPVIASSCTRSSPQPAFPKGGSWLWRKMRPVVQC